MAIWSRKLNEARVALFSSPSRAYPFWLFVVFAMCVSYYYAKEVPDQQSYILQSNFAALASGSDQLSTVLQTYVGQLAAEVDREKKDHRIPPLKGLNQDAQMETGAFVECDCSDGPSAGQAEGIVLRVRSGASAPKVHIQYYSGKSNHYPCFEASLKQPVERVMTRLVDRFDGMALSLSSGEVIYQKAQDGFRLGNIGALLEEAFQPKESGSALVSTARAPSPNAEARAGVGQTPQLEFLVRTADWRQVSYTTILEAQFETGRYKLLVQPIPVPIRLGSATSGGQDIRGDLLLIGILSERHLRAQASRLYLPQIAPLVVFFVLALLALWPVLKVWKMASTDGFSAREVVFLSGSLLAAVGLVTVVTLYGLARLDNSDIDGHLETLANKIDNKLAQELKQALNVLENATRRANRLSQNSTCSSSHLAIPSGYTEKCSILEDGEPASSLLRVYPWLDQIAWANEEGVQIQKWTVREKATRPSSFASFDFFPALQANNVWTLAADDSGATEKFLLAPIQSFNTGRYTPLILQRKSGLKGASFAVLSSYLLSVTNPTLPPHYGFAIVDETGELQFHSHPSRNLFGNMLRRLKSPAQLRDTILSRETRSFDALYLDIPVRMHAGPLRNIKGSSWTLVTWYGLDERDRFLLQVFGLSSALVLGYLTCLGLIAGLGYTFARKQLSVQRAGASPWSLPTLDSLPNLWILVVFFVVLGAVYLWIVRSGIAALTWGAIAGCPVLLLLSIRTTIRSRFVHGLGWKKPSRGAPISFVLAASCAAFLLGCLPAVGLTSISWNFRRVLYLMEAQTRLEKALDERRSSVSEEWRNIKTKNTSEFVNSRLSAALDRYDSVSFDKPEPFNQRFPHYDLGQSSCDAQQDALTCSIAAAWINGVSRGFSRESGTGTPRWRVWKLSGEGSGGNSPHEFLELKPDGGVENADVLIGELPPYPFRWWRMILAFICSALLISVTICRTLFYRFQWGHEIAPEIPAVSDVVQGHNKIVLSYPCLEVEPLLARFANAQCYSLLDLLARNDWQLGSKRVVVITGFEDGLRSAEVAARTLELLEGLLSYPGMTLVLVSAVAPVYWWTECLADTADTSGARIGAVLHRWIEVFTSFETERDDRPLEGAWARRQCYLVWKWCTPRERLVLRQLVDYGLPNPKNNRYLDNLIQRHLVTFRDVQFQIANPQFAAFVHSDLCGQEVTALFPPDADNAWRGLRLVLVYAFVLTSLVILVSFVDLWGSPLLRFFTVGGASVPLVKTAYDVLSGRGTKAVKRV